MDFPQSGKPTFEEDGLDELFNEAVKKGIRFSHEYQSTDMYIIAVPTPYDKASKKVDASYVAEAVKDVMKVCPKGATVVVESTVSPGTINKYVRPVVEERGFVIGEDINLVHAPERIIPGNMVYELKHNSRTIGADSREIGEKVKALYSSFCEGEIVVTDYIHPLPHGVREILGGFRRIVVCELNEGQLASYLRQQFQEFRFGQYNKCEGLPFTVVELKEEFNRAQAGGSGVRSGGVQPVF